MLKETEQCFPPNRIWQLLTPQQTTFMRLMQQLEVSREKSAQEMIRAAREQLKANKAPDAMMTTPEGELMYDFVSELDEVGFLRRRLLGTVLDIGPGTTAELDNIVPPERVTYVDSDQSSISLLQTKGVSAVHADARSILPFPDQSFDTIYASRSLTDFEAGKSMLPEISRVLRHTGSMLIRPHGTIADILGVLASLDERGISIGSDCKLTLSLAMRQHRTMKGLYMDVSTMFIHVQPQRNKN